MASLWQLAAAVVLRPEAFGGIAFHRQRGITLEIDEEAYRFLCTYVAPGLLPSADHPAGHLVPQLVRLGFLQPTTKPAQLADGASEASWAGDGTTLSAPETVHVAITTRCNLFCPGCYVPRREQKPELDVTAWCGLVEQWAGMRVFQIAVGGGEPLLYDGLFDVLACARDHGLVPNLTTNGTLLHVDAVRHLRQAGVKRVNVSWNSPGGDDRSREQAASRAISLLLDSTLQVGVNLLVTPTLLPRLPQVLARLQSLGVQRVTILRPKPAALPSGSGTAWYVSNRLRRVDLLRLRAVLNAWQGMLALAVDSALVGLMGDASSGYRRWRGVHGCSAGRRICTVWPDGRVTPCSFMGDLDAGNVLQMPFAQLWKQGRSWELLRGPFSLPQGGCFGCAAASDCGGARCIARFGDDDNSEALIRPGLHGGDVECLYHKG